MFRTAWRGISHVAMPSTCAQFCVGDVVHTADGRRVQVWQVIGWERARGWLYAYQYNLGRSDGIAYESSLRAV